MIGALTIVVVLLSSCSMGAPVRVLKKDQMMATASIGGPIVPTKSPIGFVPYLTAGGAYGVTDDLTYHGNVHLLMAAFGVLGLDAGASVRALHQDGVTPEITVSGRVIAFSDMVKLQNVRLYPDMQVTASWEIAPQSLVYAGTHATWQALGPVDMTSLLFSPMVGTQIPVSDKFSLQGELIWQAANVNTMAGIVEGESSIRGHGSFGVFIGGVLWL